MQKIHENINLFIPHPHHQKIKDELDQIIVLASLLDTKLYISQTAHINTTFKSIDINIKNTNLNIALNLQINTSKTNQIILVELYTIDKFHTYNTIYLYNQNNLNPYKFILKCLTHIKNAL